MDYALYCPRTTWITLNMKVVSENRTLLTQRAESPVPVLDRSEIKAIVEDRTGAGLSATSAFSQLSEADERHLTELRKKYIYVQQLMYNRCC